MKRKSRTRKKSKKINRSKKKIKTIYGRDATFIQTTNYIKKIPKSTNDLQREIEGLKILKSIDRSIVPPHYITDKSISTRKGLNLEKYTKKRRRIDQKGIILSIAKMFDTIHRKGSIHGDPGRSNILILPNGDIVLIDYETVKEVATEHEIFREEQELLHELWNVFPKYKLELKLALARITKVVKVQRKTAFGKMKESSISFRKNKHQSLYTILNKILK